MLFFTNSSLLYTSLGNFVMSVKNNVKILSPRMSIFLVRCYFPFVPRTSELNCHSMKHARLEPCINKKIKTIPAHLAFPTDSCTSMAYLRRSEWSLPGLIYLKTLASYSVSHHLGEKLCLVVYQANIPLKRFSSRSMLLWQQEPRK